MSETIAQLRNLSDERLIEKHDAQAAHAGVSINHYLQELYRRDQKQVADTMLKYTRWITAMTFIITAATIVSVVVLVRSLPA